MTKGSEIAVAMKARTYTCRNEKADTPHAARPTHDNAKKVRAAHRTHVSAHHGHDQQAAVDKANRGHKTARRLRIRRRTR